MLFEKTNPDWLVSSYYYELPETLIADRPVRPRDASKLLVYDQNTDQITHSSFYELAKFLPAKSLLVANKSKVFACRLKGHKESGAKAEIFVLSLRPDQTSNSFHCLIKTARKKRVGDCFLFKGGVKGTISSINDDGTFQMCFDTQNLTLFLEKEGMVPIPPYVRGGESDQQDQQDYQTLFAKVTGSVAAPTAGLHFTQRVFDSLKDKQIDLAEVCLHVGMGTFSSVKATHLQDHRMHLETFFVEMKEYEKIMASSFVTAVGTTTLRVLESMKKGNLAPDITHSTDIFLYPGVSVESIDALITNFHLPQSTLLMLVSSLIGRKKTLEIYQVAIDSGHRFFSYGDAMLIIRKKG